MKKLFSGKNLNRFVSFFLSLSLLLATVPGSIIIGTAEQETEPQSKDLLDPIIVSEDVTKRGENEKHFLCDDGSYIAISYPHPVHEDREGEWIDIEHEVVSDGDEISPIDDDIRVKFSNNTNSSKLVKIEADGYKISWTVEAEKQDGKTAEKVKLSKESKAAIKTNKEITKANKDKIKESTNYTLEEVYDIKKAAKKEANAVKKANKSADLSKNEIIINANNTIDEYNRSIIQSVSYPQANVEYVGAFGEGTILRYVMTPGEINEEVVLSSYNGFKSYSMVIDTDGLTPVKDENGRVNLTDEGGNVIMSIAPPYMYDSVDVISEEITVTITQYKKKTWTITYTPDLEWLSSPDRVYPVVVDPTVTTQGKNQNYLLDTYVYEGQTVPVDNSSHTLKVGRETLSDGSKREYRSYWALNDLLPMVPNGSNSIVDVSFNIKAVESTPYIGRIELSDTFSELTNTSSLTWNNKPERANALGAILSLPENNWLIYSGNGLEQVVIDSYDVSIHNFTFLLRENAPSNLGYPTEFYSSDYRPNGSTSYIPFLAIVYTGVDVGGGDETEEPDDDIQLPSGHTTMFEPGIYLIENMSNGRYLHHTEANHTVNTWNYSEQPFQQWYLKLNSDQTYSFIPLSGNVSDVSSLNYYMELYCGVDEDTQPITTYDYVTEYNTNSPYCKFYILDNNDGTYSIMPKKYHTKVLEVYTGYNTTMYYTNPYNGATRAFSKTQGQSVQINAFTGNTNQCWKFHKKDTFVWDDSLKSGIYFIENQEFGKLLTHNTENNNIIIGEKNYGLNQQWEVVKYSGDTYIFTPKSNNNYNLELFHATWNGACKDGHPITVSDYANNQVSPYIKMRLTQNTDGSYTISPLVTPTKRIDIHTNTTVNNIYNSVSFLKGQNEFVQLGLANEENEQNWIFTPVLEYEQEYDLPDDIVQELCTLRGFELDVMQQQLTNSSAVDAIREQINIIRADYILEGYNYNSEYALSLIPDFETFINEPSMESKNAYADIYKVVANRLLVLYGIQNESVSDNMYCLDIDCEYSEWTEESMAACNTYLLYTVGNTFFDRSGGGISSSERNYSMIAQIQIYRKRHDYVKLFTAYTFLGNAATEVTIPNTGRADIVNRSGIQNNCIWEVKPNKPKYYSNEYGFPGIGTLQLQAYIGGAINAKSIEKKITGEVFSGNFGAGTPIVPYVLHTPDGDYLEVCSGSRYSSADCDSGLILYKIKEDTDTQTLTQYEYSFESETSLVSDFRMVSVIENDLTGEYIILGTIAVAGVAEVVCCLCVAATYAPTIIASLGTSAAAGAVATVIDYIRSGVVQMYEMSNTGMALSY